tara:strand:+ start:1241 stop:1462 length:222 start_codon:yes stop_codon:yes gene_type:complete
VNKFNIGDLVKLDYSEHIGMVIESSDRSLSASRGGSESPVWAYRIKWADGEPYTWERSRALTLIAGINNEQSV